MSWSTTRIRQGSPPIGLALCTAGLDLSPPGLPGGNQGLALYPADLKLSLSCLSGRFNRSGFVSKTSGSPGQAT